MAIIYEKILVFYSEYFDRYVIFLHQKRDKVKLYRRFHHTGIGFRLVGYNFVSKKDKKNIFTHLWYDEF